MQTIKKLVRATHSTTIGNHAVTINNGIRTYTYHGNPICIEDTNTNIFHTNHCGWFTSSTTRAINAYKAELFNRSTFVGEAE